MRKISKVIIAVTLMIGLTGCSISNPDKIETLVTEEELQSTVSSDNDVTSDTDIVGGVDDGQLEVNEVVELKEPEIKYWDVDNNNGIPYLFAKVYNPNDVTIDLGAYIDYYAGSDKRVADENNYLLATVGPKETIAVADLSGDAFPDTDAIDVRYDFIVQSMYTLIDSDFTVNEQTEDGYGHHIDVTISEEDFYYCDVVVLYYLDGEVSGFDFATFYPGDDYSFDTSCVFDYDDYEVFVAAYKL